MITTISKSFDFDAAHHLPNMPEGHKCQRMHGHTYLVELVFRGSINPKDGCLVDYGEIAAAWKPLHDQLDHRTLNDIKNDQAFPIRFSTRLDLNPTTEILAAWIAERIGDWAASHPGTFDLHSVKVYESSTTWAEVLW